MTTSSQPPSRQQSPGSGAAGLAIAASLRAGLEGAGRIVIPLSIACYLAGFLVTMPHLSTCGVPMDAVSPQTLLAAGLLFFVLTAAAAVCGLAARTVLAEPVRLAERLAVAVVTMLVLPVSLANAVASGTSGMLYSLSIAATFLIAPDIYSISLGWTRPWWIAWDAARVLLLALGPVGAFAMTVYPNVPVHFGGGRPRPILQYTVRDGSLILAAHDQWASVGCRSLAATPPLCRQIYKTHETAGHIFVAVVDQPGACQTPMSAWSSRLARVGKVACLQRIANDEAKRLELPAEK